MTITTTSPRFCASRGQPADLLPGQRKGADDRLGFHHALCCRPCLARKTGHHEVGAGQDEDHRRAVRRHLLEVLASEFELAVVANSPKDRKQH
jgi:hypothetical protein